MASVFDGFFKFFGYQPIQQLTSVGQSDSVEKSSANTHREAIAQNPLAMAYASMNTQWGLRKPSKITFQTLRRMAAANWVDRACIETLRDEVTAIPWDITPINPKESYDTKFQQFVRELLLKPNRNNENWRTLIQKVVEDILVVDAGCLEKVRNKNDVIVELWHVDGATIKPMYDEHGVVGDPAYQQFLPGQKENSPKAEWNNKDFMYIMWNPQGSVDTFGYGLSPVEAGLAVGTAFLYAEAYTLGFFKTNTIPPMIINMGKEVPSSEIDRFRAFLAAEMMGTQGFHAPVVASFGDGFSVENLLQVPKDMAWKEYLEWQMKWKVALYRMSPQDIGFNVDMYKMEGEVQQELSQNKAINSLKGILKQYIDAEIINDYSFKNFNHNLQFQWIDTDVVDPLDQANVDKIYLQSGVKSINEVRQRDGLDPIVGGQKPLIVSGATIMQLDSTPMMTDGIEALPPVGKSFEKTFSASEGEIVSLKDNDQSICWMDDRGVTQPLFVTDISKKVGFTVKPSFLDDKKGQEPPEAEVARLLRAMKVNTPDVQIMTYEEVLQLIPESLYPSFTNWINLTAPFDSQQWRQRWGNTRKSNYYIVTGYLTGADLGNHELQKMVATSPDSYSNAVQDLARVWVAERLWYLGDRKPGHYIITQQGNGFGVDYQFFKDKNSYNKTKYYLPKTLGIINTGLLDVFERAVEKTVEELGHEDLFGKTYRPHLPKDWERMHGYEDVEKRFSKRIQKGIWDWYKKATNVKARKQMLMRKANEVDPGKTKFDPSQSYITTGAYVFQNGRQFPISVLPVEDRPTLDDIRINAGDYQDGFNYGAEQARVIIAPNIPQGIKVRNAELYAPMFQKRANLVTGTIDSTLKKLIDDVIVRGIDGGSSYGEIADQIQQALGVDENDPSMPGWRAERIARTEAQWAISEGMRNQYEEAGVEQVNVSPAMTACDECVDVANGNPYDVGEAEGILPIHPNCRCVLVGDYSDFLKSQKKKEVKKKLKINKSDLKQAQTLVTKIEKHWITTENGNHIFLDDSGGGNAHRGGAGSAVAGAQTQFSYTPSGNLTPKEREVEERFGKQLTDNPDAAIQEYESRFDHELNTDNARELSADYSASKDSRAEYAAAVHEPASALTKEMYTRDLNMSTPEGKQNMVLFTAGGTGAGKSSALRDVPEMQNMKNSAKLVYDTNMNTYSSAKSKIDAALQTGHNVGIVYVNRDPEESLLLGAIPRAQRMGRTVPLTEHVATHVGALNTIKQLSDTYAGDPRVNIKVIDNTRGKGGAVLSSIDSLKGMNYNAGDLTNRLNFVLDRAYEQGQISTQIYNGFKGGVQ